MKLLNLVLYSETNPSYPHMKAESWKLYSQMPNVVTWYYRYDDHLRPGEVVLRADERLLLIGGMESYIPGILTKTIQAFMYAHAELQATTFDYIVRSNVSSVVDFEVLERQLTSRPIHFGSSYLQVLNYLDPKSGVHDSTHWGFTFTYGVCIVFSPAAFTWLLEQRSNLVMSLIDDLAIPKLVGTKFPPRLVSDDPRAHWVVPPQVTQHHLRATVSQGRTVLYRNRNDSNRFQDVANMSQIVQAILQRRRGAVQARQPPPRPAPPAISPQLPHDTPKKVNTKLRQFPAAKRTPPHSVQMLRDFRPRAALPPSPNAPPRESPQPRHIFLSQPMRHPQPIRKKKPLVHMAVQRRR